MPVNVTYPGVYVQELPSTSHTIVGIATSITAFLGRAPFGPINDPITVFNFGDFERLFGGLVHDYPMSYAVRDFFLNGGSQALIGRLFEPTVADDPTSGTAVLPLSKHKTKKVSPQQLLTLVAANPGAWGNTLQATVDHNNLTEAVAAHYTQYDLTLADLFNLTITKTLPNGLSVVERYSSVTTHPGKAPNRLDRVLNEQSSLVAVPLDKEGEPILPAKPPLDGATGKGTGGNDGVPLTTLSYLGSEAEATGLYLLNRAEIFNLLCLPPDLRQGDIDPSVLTEAAEYCVKRRAILIVDPPAAWKEYADQGKWSKLTPDDPSIDIVGTNARNAALYFPRVIQEDLTQKDQLDVFPACGIIAGVIASSDITNGVWKAPAGLNASLVGIHDLQVKLTDAENGLLNPLGINCLRTFPTIGPVVWGARTLRGADQFADDYRYLNVRRLALFIEESLVRGTRWAVFEPNDEALWAALRQSISAFMADLSNQGAFEAYKVTCDATTTTPADIAKGIVNMVVAFTPVNPSEYIVLHIQQQAPK